MIIRTISKTKNETGTLKVIPLNLMVYIQVYLIAIIFLYFFGPVKWDTHNTFFTFFMILMYQIMLGLGYKYEIRKGLYRRTGRLCSKEYILRKFNVILLGSISLDTLLFIRRASLMTGGLWRTIYIALTDYKALYFNETTLTSSQMIGGRAVAAMIPLLGPISMAMIPLASVFYKDLSVRSRILTIIAVIIRLLSSLSLGASEGIFDIGIAFIASIFIKRSYTKIYKSNYKVKSKSKKNFIIVIMGIAIIYIFTLIMTNRTGGTYNLALGVNSIDSDNVLIKIFPAFKLAIIYLSVYLCQGYYGFSLATSLKWNPTFGFGYSYYLRENIEDLIGIDITGISYQGQAEIYGWGANANWHSVYTWFANDISIFGTVLLMFFIGRLIAGLYKDSIYNQNPIAIALFSLMVVFVLYIPANNKLFANPQTFTAFWFYLVIWLFSKKYKES